SSILGGFEGISVAVAHNPAVLIRTHAIPLHHPLDRRLAAHDIVISLQWNASNRDALVVLDDRAILALLVFAKAHLLDAVIRGFEPAAAFDGRIELRHDVVAQMELGERAPRSAECPEVLNAFHARNARQLFA